MCCAALFSRSYLACPLFPAGSGIEICITAIYSLLAHLQFYTAMSRDSRPYHYSSRGAPPAPPAPVQGRGRAISSALAPAGGRSAAVEPEHRPGVVSLSQTAARSATVFSCSPGQGTREESPDDDDGPPIRPPSSHRARSWAPALARPRGGFDPRLQTRIPLGRGASCACARQSNCSDTPRRVRLSLT